MHIEFYRQFTLFFVFEKSPFQKMKSPQNLHFIKKLHQIILIYNKF